MVKMAIDSLRPQHKEIIKLKYLEDKTQAEISKIINKSESAVEGLLYRARKALKKEISKVMRKFYRLTSRETGPGLEFSIVLGAKSIHFGLLP